MLRDGQWHADGINVKSYTGPVGRGKLSDETVNAIYEEVREQFWADAESIADGLGYDGVEQHGRSGGWLVPYYGSSARLYHSDLLEREREELADALDEAEWSGPAEDIREGMHPDTILSRLAKIGEDSTEVGSIIAEHPYEEAHRWKEFTREIALLQKRCEAEAEKRVGETARKYEREVAHPYTVELLSNVEERDPFSAVEDVLGAARTLTWKVTDDTTGEVTWVDAETGSEEKANA